MLESMSEYATRTTHGSFPSSECYCFIDFVIVREGPFGQNSLNLGKYAVYL